MNIEDQHVNSIDFYFDGKKIHTNYTPRTQVKNIKISASYLDIKKQTTIRVLVDGENYGFGWSNPKLQPHIPKISYTCKFCDTFVGTWEIDKEEIKHES